MSRIHTRCLTHIQLTVTTSPMCRFNCHISRSQILHKKSLHFLMHRRMHTQCNCAQSMVALHGSWSVSRFGKRLVGGLFKIKRRFGRWLGGLVGQSMTAICSYLLSSLPLTVKCLLAGIRDHAAAQLVTWAVCTSSWV